VKVVTYAVPPEFKTMAYSALPIASWMDVGVPLNDTTGTEANTGEVFSAPYCPFVSGTNSTLPSPV